MHAWFLDSELSTHFYSNWKDASGDKGAIASASHDYFTKLQLRLLKQPLIVV